MMIKKVFIVEMMENLEYIVIFVISIVQKDFIKIICDHKLTLILFVKKTN